jgi:hypothetical protein
MTRDFALLALIIFVGLLAVIIASEHHTSSYAMPLVSEMPS